MGKYNRSLAREFGKLLIKDNDDEIKQYLEEERIREEKDMAWRQRKYELSNSFGEELIYFDDKLDGFYSEVHKPFIYDTDELWNPIFPGEEVLFDSLTYFKKQYPWLFDDSSKNIHLPDNLQNTRGYNHAFVSK